MEHGIVFFLHCIAVRMAGPFAEPSVYHVPISVEFLIRLFV